jgi:hypothetical protein
LKKKLQSNPELAPVAFVVFVEPNTNTKTMIDHEKKSHCVVSAGLALAR